MKLTIHLQRVGMSRVAEANIPIQARIIQGGKVGENLLSKDRFSDVEHVKAELKRRLEKQWGRALDVEWIDKTSGQKRNEPAGEPASSSSALGEKS